ncbi:MAG: YgeY family selenium metabolism-linked hydrolase [Anaerolineales bacterium]
MSDPIQKIPDIRQRIEAHRDAMLTFFKELCAIPSMDSQIEAVAQRAAQEMEKLGFRKVWYDKQGNVVGEIGDGPRKLVYDSHLDTVGIGDPDEWEWDPFTGKEEDGVYFARGACDEKNSTPGMIYGLAFAHELGLLEGLTAYFFGNIEEWDDGVAPQVFVEEEGIRPDFVVIGEPTNMKVYRGHKGRVEMKVVAKGKSAHAASNYLGDNPIYKLLPIIDAIKDMQPQLGNDPFLGEGRITVTDIHVETPSINAVPGEAVMYIDRRMTFGEDAESCKAQIQALIGDREDVTVEILRDSLEAYNGFVMTRDKIYPAWAHPNDHPLVQAGLDAIEALTGEKTEGGKWDFSTNGTYWSGLAGIPSIGYGPGNEIHAHTVLDQVRLDDVVEATAFYALLPGLLPD